MNNANISPSKDPALYDKETEQSLLSIFFISRRNKDGKPEGQAAYIKTKAEGLKAKHFYYEENRLIYKAAEKIFNGGEMIDLAAITQELVTLEQKGKIPKIPNKISLLTLITQKEAFSDNAPRHAKKIIDLAERRHIVDQANSLKAIAVNMDISTEDIKQGTLLAMVEDTTTDKTPATEPTCYDIMQMFSAEQDSRHYSTGLKGLDKILDGGLYAGLYIVGAISSLGKTTLCLQIGDYIAAHGQDVLVFSLEMSRRELMAKSLSRIMAQKDRSNAKTTRAILQGQKNWNPAEQSLLADSIAEYAESTGQHLYISVGMGDITPDTIRAATIRHYMKTGNYPVIIIDYVQILAPSDVKATDKQNMDKAVLELKRISRDYNTPVIGISSFNRDNYTAPVNMAAFKESGSLEYSSDVLIGLQYDFMEPREGERKEARAARIEQDTKQAIAAAKEGKPIIINAKVLKNRNGSKGTAIMQFTPMFNYFEEVDGLLHGEPVSSKIIPR